MSEPIRWKVSVDSSRCQGHNRCYAIAPELFEVDDYGISSAKGEGLVPPALDEKARLATKNCPEHAVGLTRIRSGGEDR